MSLSLYSERKRVSVTFAGDDDVGKHITSLSAKSLRTRAKKKTSTYEEVVSDISEVSDAGEEDDIICKDDVFKPSAALSEESGLTGDKVYGFMTTKRASQMTVTATKSVEALAPCTPPKSSRSAKASLPTTPKSILKRTRGASQVLVETGQTPVGKRSTNRVKRLAALTPQRISSRLHTVQYDSSSEESVSSESSDDDSDVSDTPPVPTRTRTPAKATKSTATPKSTKSTATPKSSKTTATPKSTGRRSRRKPELDETVKTDVVEDYFDAHSSSTVLTSDRTLSRLDTPCMDQNALNQVLGDVETIYREERLALLDDYRSQFDKWMFLLCHRYNLVLHGLGSKRHLLEEFRTTMLKDLNHVVINGYFPSLTIKNILNAITEEVMEHEGSFRNPIEQCDFIRKHYECGDYEDFFLVIHNIDGGMLRGDKSQTVLSLLAQIRGFHVIASIDHLNAPLMWDNTKCSRFNWLWQDVTSYDTYSEETSYENSLMVQQSGTLALSSLTHVMRSLTPNAKGIFMLLVRYQLEHGKDSAGYQGLSFTDLYQKCREAFLVNSDLTLRTQLTEFKDHKLIKLKKGMDGIEYLAVPLDDATLKEFTEQQEAEES